MAKDHEGSKNKRKKHRSKKKAQSSTKSADMPVLKPDAGPPKSAEDFSTNWKKLQETLGLSKKRKKKNPGKAVPEKKPRGIPGSTAKNGDSELWFELEDVHLLAHPPKPVLTSSEAGSQPSLTRAVAVDCEMVGVGFMAKDSALARVSIVNEHGQCLYDSFVKPLEKVTDYRTHVSGVTSRDLHSGKPFSVVQKEVHDILKDRIVVGHALKNDLKVLYLDYPRRLLRDTSKYKPFRKLMGGGTPSLKKLALQILGLKIQEGQHSSVQDAAATMQLYRLHKKEWEKSLQSKRKKKDSS